jgi:hypothetical protein
MANTYKALKDCQYRDGGGKIRFAHAGDMVEWHAGMPDLPPCFENFEKSVKKGETQGDPPSPPKFDRMTVAELEAFAAEHLIGLEGCENKAQRIEAIKKGLEPKSPDEGPGF